MKFLFEDSHIDFRTTQITNIFLEDFMPVANGDFVKVYLYAYKNTVHSFENFILNNEILAKNLQLTIADIENAWKYWEEQGVIEKKLNLDGSYDIEFKDLRNIYVQMRAETIEKSPKTEEKQDIFANMQSLEIRNLFNNIDYFMRRPTSPTEKMEVLNWISQYNMSTEMIEIAFEYCVEKKKYSVNYIAAVVRSWYDKGLSSVEEIEAEIEKSDRKYVRKNSVLRKLGLQFRMVSEPEIELINSWYDLHNFPEDLIDEALSRTSQIPRPSINYVNSILLKWKDLGISNIEEIKEKDTKPSKIKKINKNSFHNFKGQSTTRTDEELNEIARKITARRNKISE